MKRILLFWVVMMPFCLLAQTESPHLSFKGVPIDGTLDEYVQKMKQKGLAYLGTDNGIAILTGEFASYKGCVIGVATLQQKDLVSKITVIFPYCETWTSLINNYYSIKEMLKEKYGEPAEVIEQFQGNTEPDDDLSKMRAVQSDSCTYVTTFVTGKGNIQVYISRNSAMRCCVLLSYFDKYNGGLIKTKAMEDL